MIHAFSTISHKAKHTSCLIPLLNLVAPSLEPPPSSYFTRTPPSLPSFQFAIFASYSFSFLFHFFFIFFSSISFCFELNILTYIFFSSEILYKKKKKQKGKKLRRMNSQFVDHHTLDTKFINMTTSNVFSVSSLQTDPDLYALRNKKYKKHHVAPIVTAPTIAASATATVQPQPIQSTQSSQLVSTNRLAYVEALVGKPSFFIASLFSRAN